MKSRAPVTGGHIRASKAVAKRQGEELSNENSPEMILVLFSLGESSRFSDSFDYDKLTIDPVRAPGKRLITVLWHIPKTQRHSG